MRNPLRGIRFALLDFNNAKGSIGTKIAMVAIISIPLIYGALFPLAFYDPYGNINKVPVAVVNEDRGATLDDGSSLDVGDELVQSLKDSDEGMKWEYVDAETAQRGHGGRHLLHGALHAAGPLRTRGERGVRHPRER